MQIKRISVFSIPVSDQAAAKAFYTEVLGFHVIADNPMGPNQRWIQLAIPGAETSVTLVTWFDKMPAGGSQGMVLETTDLAADYAILQERGLALAPIEKAFWGDFTTFNDPDGNGWVLRQAEVSS